MAAVFVNNSVNIKGATMDLGTFRDIALDGTTTQFYNFCKAVNRLQKQTLKRVVYTEQHSIWAM